MCTFVNFSTASFTLERSSYDVIEGDRTLRINVERGNFIGRDASVCKYGEAAEMHQIITWHMNNAHKSYKIT